MISCDYLVIGGQLTADACVQGIREVDRKGRVVVVGDDPHPPYNRPPLSKGLWKGEPVDDIWRTGGIERENVEWRRGVRVVSLDVTTSRAMDDRGEEYAFKRCLLATGGAPRRLPFGGERIIHYRTFADYRHLRGLCERGTRFAVIGGGFIGSEMAAALAMNGKAVTMIFPGTSIGSRLFPADLSGFVTARYRERGVDVLAGYAAEDLLSSRETSVLRVRPVDGGASRDLLVDGVVAGIGIEPNVTLAQNAGLEIDDGIVVNEHLQTSAPNIYAAGDVASFYSPHLGRRMRVEHEDHAITSGRVAGRAMAGDDIRYDHLPFFYSDLFELGYEAVGELDPRNEIVADWVEPYREGVVWYLRDQQVRGVLLWGIFGRVDEARELIASKRAWRPEALRGRLTQPVRLGLDRSPYTAPRDSGQGEEWESREKQPPLALRDSRARRPGRPLRTLRAHATGGGALRAVARRHRGRPGHSPPRVSPVYRTGAPVAVLQPGARHDGRPPLRRVGGA